MSIAADFGNGPVTVTLTGNLKGDVMAGVADIGGEMQIDWGAKRMVAAAAQPAGGTADAAFDVSGAWGLDVTSDVGSGNPTITLEQSGDRLTGRYSGQLGEAPLTGTLKGNAITFEFPVDVQGTQMTVVYSGTVERDSMKGTVKLGDVGEGTFTGSRRK